MFSIFHFISRQQKGRDSERVVGIMHHTVLIQSSGIVYFW
jgi:hypothetical protein